MQTKKRQGSNQVLTTWGPDIQANYRLGTARAQNIVDESSDQELDFRYKSDVDLGDRSCV